MHTWRLIAPCGCFGANIRLGAVPGCAPEYLNNIVEQDHRGIKSRTGPMLGFQLFNNAATAIAGIELIRRIKKGQFKLGQFAAQRKTVPQIWAAVLAA